MNHRKIKNVAVLGLGKSGVSAVRLCSKLGIKCSAFDERKLPDENVMEDLLSGKKVVKIEIWNGQNLAGIDCIVISPGIGKKSGMYKDALKSGIPIVSELEFASFFCGTPILAITGTNGKTTTTELTRHLLDAIGKKSVCAGNIGTPLSDFAVRPEDYECIVAEVSSFQLEETDRFSPLSAALLNIESDHMDRYDSLDDYAETKFRIFRNIKSGSNAIIRYDLLDLWKRFGPAGNSPVTFSSTDSNADFYLERENTSVRITRKAVRGSLNISGANLKGRHNSENIMASLALVLSAFEDADIKALEKAVCEFRGAEHRIELVAEKDGIRYINDSKATNPDSVRAALRTVGASKNVCLIAGGLDKNMDFSPLMEEIHRVKAIFLVGECKNKLFDLFNTIVKCTLCNNFEDVVIASCKYAESGDVVLLSPGCASMDMFKDYKERGNIFKAIIKRRLEI